MSYEQWLYKIFQFTYILYTLSYLIFEIITKISEKNKFAVATKDNEGLSDVSHKVRTSIKRYMFFLGSMCIIYMIVMESRNPFVRIFSMYSLFIFGFTAISSMGKSFQDILFKPYRFKLTENHQYGFLMAGFVTSYIYKYPQSLSNVNVASVILPNTDVFLIDLIVILVQLLWNFLMYFLILVYLMIFARRVLFFIRKRSKGTSRLKRNTKQSKGLDYLIFTIRVESHIDAKPTRGLLYKVIIYLVWFFAVLFDSSLGLIILIIYNIYLNIKGLVKIVLNWIVMAGTKLVDLMCNTPDKRIVLLSRFSIVFSLTTLFFIDKYNKVLSNSGSEVYEFLCGVIIIPMVITQALEISRNKEQHAVSIDANNQ